MVFRNVARVRLGELICCRHCSEHSRAYTYGEAAGSITRWVGGPRSSMTLSAERTRHSAEQLESELWIFHEQNGAQWTPSDILWPGEVLVAGFLAQAAERHGCQVAQNQAYGRPPLAKARQT